MAESKDAKGGSGSSAIRTGSGALDLGEAETTPVKPDEYGSTLPLSEVAPPSGGRSHGLTDVGCVRRENEDAIVIDEARGLWAVCDGMGGHEGGELASNKVVEALAALEMPENPLQAMAAIEHCIYDVNQELTELAMEMGADLMGTTVVLAYDAGSHYMIGWLGDSRCYAIRDAQCVVITRDHCKMEEALELGIGWEDLRADPLFENNKISRAVGAAQGRPRIDWRIVDAARHTRLLLCSDGLYKAVPRRDISRLVRNTAATAEKTAWSLLHAAIDNRANDNVSVVVIDPRS